MDKKLINIMGMSTTCLLVTARLQLSRKEYLLLYNLKTYLGKKLLRHNFYDTIFSKEMRSKYLVNFFSELKSWRKVYWRLWGICHVLYCSLCCSYFQVYMHEFCSFHPQDPDFPNIQFKNSTQPFGSYPCCTKSVNRFQPLPPNVKGCQSRDHRVKLRHQKEVILPYPR